MTAKRRSITSPAPFKVGDRVFNINSTKPFCRGTVTTCEMTEDSYGRAGTKIWKVTVRIDGETTDTRPLNAWKWRDLAEVEAYEALPAIERLEAELARHDWYCAMSDSYGTTLAGDRHMAEMIELARECDPKAVRKLWKAAMPPGFFVPTEFLGKK